MGQEVGHAYEDLLELALLQLIEEKAFEARKVRVSPRRYLKGVSGNIDHLLEQQNSNGDWVPYVLFMEKHSDSSNESEKHFRRHLEEYVQAKQASIELFNFPLTAPMKVVNLIYGRKGGWKESILNESNRYLVPTIYLPEKTYSVGIDKIVDSAIVQCRRPYNRTKIAESLSSSVRRSRAFNAFKQDILDCLVSKNGGNAAHNSWLEGEIRRGRKSIAQKINAPRPIYARRALTQLLLLSPDMRRKVIKSIGDQSAVIIGDALNHASLTAAINLPGSTLEKPIGNYRIRLSDQLYAFGQVDKIESLVELIEKAFLDKRNELDIGNRDYLAYFDIREGSFIEIARGGVEAIIRLIDGKRDPVLKFLTGPLLANKLVQAQRNDEQVALQNLRLESMMAISSLCGKQVSGTRMDLSTATLSEYSGVAEHVVKKARRSVISPSIAKKFIAGFKEFFHELNVISAGAAKRYVNGELSLINVIDNLRDADSVAILPQLLNAEKVMSLSWFRHNQLNSHPIFNPLTPLVHAYAQRSSGANYEQYGFPAKRSANPIELVLKNKDLGSYEYTIVRWEPKKRVLHVYETCSVINLKHTSDKTKEFCAKVRVVKALLRGHCEMRFWLLIDGDWTIDHVQDLYSAGWDSVVDASAFMKKFS